MMEITFGKKFTPKDLDTYLEKYLNVSFDTTDFNIVFNLECLEWIRAC